MVGVDHAVLVFGPRLSVCGGNTNSSTLNTDPHVHLHDYSRSPDIISADAVCAASDDGPDDVIKMMSSHG